MSDSDDFGGLSATTPVAPGKRKVTQKPASRSDTAGPSTRPAGGGRKKAATKAPNFEKADSDVQEIPVERIDDEDEVEDEDDTVQVVPPPRRASRKPGSKGSAVPTNTNGRVYNATAKGKGKAKTKAQSSAQDSRTSKPVEVEAEVLDVDDDDGDGEMEVDSGPMDVAAAINAAARAGRSPVKTQNKPQQSFVNQENVRLKRELQRKTTHIEDLKGQLEELFQIRNTEAEKILKEQAEQYDITLREQDKRIAYLNAQLARKEPLLRAGSGNSVIQLLTREEADEEMKGVKKQADNFKSELVKAKQRLEEKDREIVDFKLVARDLRTELNAEIERAKVMANQVQRNPPPSATRGKGAVFEPNEKTGRVIALYEDLTNLLVSHVKYQKGKYLDTDEWGFHCVYTHSDPTEVDPNPHISKSLSFLLRVCHDLRAGESEPVSSKDQLVESVHFVPLELDKEAPEFVESLNFLNQPFTFEKSQLSLFIRTLYDNLSESMQNDSVVMVGSD